jgi:heterodisulfide reductase subunit A
LKVGDLVRKKFPDVKVFNIHDNLVFGTPREAQMYAHQRHAGTVFLHCPDLTSIRVSRNNGHIRVAGQGLPPLDVDMVVLATGIKPSPAARELADKLHVDLDRDGFFAPDHSLLHATGTSLDGIYVAGCAAAPCDVATSVTQAQAAAGDAVSKLMPGREIELEVLTCLIDEEKCAGCKLCISVCPYKAIAFDRVKKVSAVNEAICRGCGTCAATCASGAARARHFTDHELLAEIGGLIHA